MNDILRTFRIGTINLLGVTIPGLMFLLLLTFGCITPLLFDVSCWMKIKILLSEIPPVGKVDGRVWIAVTLVVAYVVGYVFRLSTPDVLDMKSAKIVLKKMIAKHGPDAPEKDHWPYRGEDENKYPYFHFRDYLKHRKHNELAELVTWDSKVRSKTFVNKMKFETALRCPTLSAMVDSNEAHVRLMFGTWLACRLTRPFVALGFGATVAAIWSGFDGKSAFSQPPLLLWLAITIFLLIGNFVAIRRIEDLFHYRRVRELFDIVECYHLAVEGFELDGSPKKHPVAMRAKDKKIADVIGPAADSTSLGI